MVRRVLAVAGLRAREGLRGPVLWFLLFFAALAAAAALWTPGEPGLERQRAVDGFVLDAALLVSILAAAALGAASLPGDREAGRESLLRAGPIRDPEFLVGGLLGHAAGLVVLLFGMYLGTLSVTALLAGGDRDRAPTRTPLRAELLRDYQGRPVVGRWSYLVPTANAATYTLNATADDLEPGEDADAYVNLREIVDDMNAGIPETYPVAIRVGEGPERITRNRTGNPLTFTIDRAELAGEGGIDIEIRRIGPAYTLGVAPGGLVVQGRIRSFPQNLLKTFAGWLLGLIVVAAGANALAAVVGAPVAAAGTLLIALVGRSLGLLSEAAVHLERAHVAVAGVGRVLLELVSLVVPDLTAYDLSMQITTRWDINLGVLGSRALAALSGAGALLLLTLALRAVRRRI